MPFVSQKARLQLSAGEKERLQQLTNSRVEKHARVERARILLAFAAGENLSAIARQLATNRVKVNRCVNKALAQGVEAALEDSPRPGRPREVSDEAIAWVVTLACMKPTDFGYASELWTYSTLVQHIRKHGPAAGYPELGRATRSVIHGILNRHEVRPHKLRYFLEQRDPEFERKKAEILVVYKQVAQVNEAGPEEQKNRKLTTICVDEKPGMQALENVRPDRRPEPGQQPTWGRDHEYIRHGTLSLLGGIDLHTGKVIGIVRRRHRSREFIELLRRLDEAYPEDWKIRLVLDNHSSHISKETRAYLATRPNRFEFIFTPKHGSWLNLIEIFFSKMTRSFLRGIRVRSLEELGRRLEQYLEEVNAEPVVFRWKYQVEDGKV